MASLWASWSVNRTVHNRLINGIKCLPHNQNYPNNNDMMRPEAVRMNDFSPSNGIEIGMVCIKFFLMFYENIKHLFTDKIMMKNKIRRNVSIQFVNIIANDLNNHKKCFHWKKWWIRNNILNNGYRLNIRDFSLLLFPLIFHFISS